MPESTIDGSVLLFLQFAADQGGRGFFYTGWNTDPEAHEA